MINKKIIIGTMFCTFSLGAISQTNMTANIDVKANAVSGCVIKANPFNFSDTLVLHSSTNGNMTLQCSKGISVRINGTDKNNPALYNGPRMWRVGETTDKPETRIRYGIFSDTIVSTPDFEVISHPLNKYIWNYSSGSNNFSLNIKMITGNAVVLPFNAKVLESRGVTSGETNIDFNSKKILPGDYTDDFTYTLTF